MSRTETHFSFGVVLHYKKHSIKKLTYLILTSLLLINCNSNVKDETKPNNPQYSSKVEDKIENVLNNLQVATEVVGNFESKTSAERMAIYHTPAVVNNGEIEWLVDLVYRFREQYTN